MVGFANSINAEVNLRKELIKSLPDDGSIDKERLWLLFYYQNGDLKKALEILKKLDLSKIVPFEAKLFAEIAHNSEDWDLEIKLLKNLTQFAENEKELIGIQLQMFVANYNLGDFLRVAEIGESLLGNKNEISLLDKNRQETLLGQTVFSRIKRGENKKAVDLIEKHKNISHSFEFKISIEANAYLKVGDAAKALSAIVSGVRILKNPTPEQYGELSFMFNQIDHLKKNIITSPSKVEDGCFVKIKNQERWYFVGTDCELDATKIDPKNNKYPILKGKKVGDGVEFPDDKYRSSKGKRVIENIQTIEGYILWQARHKFQKLTEDSSWERAKIIEVPTKAGIPNMKYVTEMLKDQHEQSEKSFKIYCDKNVPLALLAVSEGSLTNAIAKITTEGRGFVRFSDGSINDFEKQKEVARKALRGDDVYLDATSALILSETGLVGKITKLLPNFKIPQSVLNFLFETADRFRYIPGQVGHMGYSQGRIVVGNVEEGKRLDIENNFRESIRILESNPDKNIRAVAKASKTDHFTEKNIPAEMSDACILAQEENSIVMTEDFLFLQANSVETKKKAPEYFSALALMRVLLEEKKIGFDEYLNFFGYLSAYRFRFLPISVEDIEKAVFGDGEIKFVKPENLRKFNFPLTLSEEYGVPFPIALRVMVNFVTKILLDDSVPLDVTERIFTEIVNAFLSSHDRFSLGRLLIDLCSKLIEHKQRTGIIIGLRSQEKIDALIRLIEIYKKGGFFRF